MLILWVDSVFALVCCFYSDFKIQGLSGSDIVDRKRCQIILKTLLFENGREDEKASAGGAQVFLETRAPTFNSITSNEVVPAQNK